MSEMALPDAQRLLGLGTEGVLLVAGRSAKRSESLLTKMTNSHVKSTAVSAVKLLDRELANIGIVSNDELKQMIENMLLLMPHLDPAKPEDCFVMSITNALRTAAHCRLRETDNIRGVPRNEKLVQSSLRTMKLAIEALELGQVDYQLIKQAYASIWLDVEGVLVSRHKNKQVRLEDLGPIWPA